MAAYVHAALGRGSRFLHRPPAVLGVRSLHRSRIVNAAKRKHRPSDASDLDFGFEEGASDELFTDKATPKPKRLPTANKPKSPTSAVTPTKAVGAQTSKDAKAIAEERRTRFNALYQSVSEHFGKQPIQTGSQLRASAWTHLFGLATTKQQMEKVVKLFPEWRDKGRSWPPQVAESFVRRCEELRCPQLALQVFSDHPKYGFDLSTLSAGRRLLHSLHISHPLSDSITVSALYKVYDLPAVSSDLVSCAMLTSACFKHNTPESVTVAKQLVPGLRQLLEKTPPTDMALPAKTEKVLRARTEFREKAWLAWTLAKVQKALEKRGEDFEWLRQWRVQSGHAHAAA